MTDKNTQRGEQYFGTILPVRETYPQPELAFTLTVVLLARRWRSILDEHLRAAGHSASRMEAVAAIAYSAAGATQIQIAKRIGIEGPTLTRTLDLLEADGLVERLADASDRRNKHMRLTDAGYRALAHMFDICADLRDQLLAGLPETEIRQNLGFLRMLMGRLDGGLALQRPHPAPAARA